MDDKINKDKPTKSQASKSQDTKAQQGKSGGDKSQDNLTCTKLKEEIRTLKEQLAFALADFKNYQNRVEARSNEEKLRLKVQVFKDVIDLFENLFRAVENLSDDIKQMPDIQGVLLILEQYRELLKKYQIEEIVYNQGDSIDITYTQVVGKAPVPKGRNTLEGKVAQLVSPGYKVGNMIIKPARVIVYSD